MRASLAVPLACDHHHLVPFSCKTRGLCSSCGGRRMATRAVWLVDRVIPEVPVRQWVLTFPWQRRLLVARRPDLLRALLGVALDEILYWLTERAGGPASVPAAWQETKTGSITMVRRFGSSLALVSSALYLALSSPHSGALWFVAVRPPSTEDVEALVVEFAERREQSPRREALWHMIYIADADAGLGAASPWVVPGASRWAQAR